MLYFQKAMLLNYSRNALRIINIFYRNAGDRIRTYASTKLLRPKRSPFDHSGTPASKKRELFCLIKFVIYEYK